MGHTIGVKLRTDFRDPNIVGTFLYHCHILKHEDLDDGLHPGAADREAAQR